MLIEEGTSANLELVPGMPGEDILSGLSVGNLEHIDSMLEVATGLIIWYKILLGVFGSILALAVLLKIIGV